MKVSTILDHIDSGHMALPEFQRGYVWNRDQVRALMDSMYRRHPVGSLLVWVTGSDAAQYRGAGELPAGTVKLLLDGQQRMTTLYGVIRGTPPRFFDGNADAFTGLYLHLDREEFAFYSPIKMKDDPLWVDVSALMKQGNDGLGAYINRLNSIPEIAPRVGQYVGRLSTVLGVRDIEFHVQEVTGADKTIDVVVDIFNRVNSGGTKLSKGDLALAKICAEWPDGRKRMKAAINRWRNEGFHFDLDWLLRNVNTVVTGEARFTHLHDLPAEQIRVGVERAEKWIDLVLNLISGRLGLDHDRVLFGKYAIPVMVHYVDRKGGHLANAEERDKLLFWYLSSALWGRFSGSTESVIDKDLRTLEVLEGGLDRLIAELRLWHGSLKVVPGHFSGWGLGARFYPMLYLLTRVGEAKDWDLGIALRKALLGQMSRLEVHHIFPKAVLYKAGYSRADVNAVANFCFQTKATNLLITDRLPEEYFPKFELSHPGVLASQWIPMDPSLWKVERYLDFLEARRALLAGAANAFFNELAHGAVMDDEEGPSVERVAPASSLLPSVPGGIESEVEEQALFDLSAWVAEQGLPEGEVLYELSDPETGAPLAILDLAWPSGLQEGYSAPVALLLNESRETLQAANAQGFRYFTTIETFKRYVLQEVLVETTLFNGAMP